MFFAWAVLGNRASALVFAFATAACATSPASLGSRATSTPRDPTELQKTPHVPVQAPATVLLSAQLGLPGPGDADFVLPVRSVVHVVFSRPLDPLTVVPGQFILAMADGRRVVPIGAFLEIGEPRSVTLLLTTAAVAPANDPDGVPAPSEPAPSAPAGETSATTIIPVSVTVVGPVHDNDGRILDGLAADIRGFTDPVVAVHAEPASVTGCVGVGLRVLWSAPVRPGVERPRVSRIDGTQTPAEPHPTGVRATLLMDYCAGGTGAAISAVELPAGVVVDRRGAANTAVRLGVPTRQ